jgi:hypothetical protein
MEKFKTQDFADFWVDPQSHFSTPNFHSKSQIRYPKAFFGIKFAFKKPKCNAQIKCSSSLHLPSSLHRCSIASTSIPSLLILSSIHPALSHSRPLMAHHHPRFILKRDD